MINNGMVLVRFDSVETCDQVLQMGLYHFDGTDADDSRMEPIIDYLKIEKLLNVPKEA